MDIGEVAKRSGLPASTLRYYEEIGLIRSIGRHGLRRIFDTSVLQHLAFIALGQAAGFSLDEIGSMFSAKGELTINRKVLLLKADEIDVTIRRLTAMSNGLRHAAVCKAENHLECPKFQRLLNAAAKGKITGTPKKRKV